VDERMINLGDEVKDIITGFEGVAISRVEQLFGATKIEVQQRNLNGDDRPMDSIWFVESQLEVKRKSICFENDGCLITPEELSEARTSES
jgi:hypothetical protein